MLSGRPGAQALINREEVVAARFSVAPNGAFRWRAECPVFVLPAKYERKNMESKRLSGVVARFVKERNFGFVRAAGNHEYLANGRDVVPDEVGRQFLIPGEDVTFSLRPHSDGRSKAVDIEACRQPIEVDLLTYQEYGKIAFWNGMLFEEGLDQQATMFQPVGGIDHIPYAFSKRLGMLTARCADSAALPARRRCGCSGLPRNRCGRRARIAERIHRG